MCASRAWQTARTRPRHPSNHRQLLRAQHIILVRSARRLPRRYGNLHFLGSPDHREYRLLADAFLREQSMQLIDTGDGVTVERNDDVSLSQAAFCRRAVGLDRHDKNTAWHSESKEANDLPR